MKQFFVLFLLLLTCSWAVLPLMLLLDVFVIENDRPTSPLHLLFVWALLPLLLHVFAFSAPSVFAVALLGAGASSNLIWRLTFGPVPDYIPLPMNIYTNVADIFLLLGGGIYLFLLASTFLKIWKPSLGR